MGSLWQRDCESSRYGREPSYNTIPKAAIHVSDTNPHECTGSVSRRLHSVAPEATVLRTISSKFSQMLRPSCPRLTMRPHACVVSSLNFSVNFLLHSRRKALSAKVVRVHSKSPESQRVCPHPPNVSAIQHTWTDADPCQINSQSCSFTAAPPCFSSIVSHMSSRRA